MAGKHSADDIFISIFINYPTVGILIHVTGDIHHFGQRDIIMFHAGRVEQHLIFFNITSQYGNLCHTSCRKQSRTDSPVCQRTKVEHGSGIRSQSDNQQLTQNRRLRTHCRLTHIFGQFLADQRKFLTDNLTSQINIGIPFKFHPNDREAIGGRRTHPTHMGRTVYGSLYGEGNQLFHFLGGHTVRFGHNHYSRRIQIGEHIDFRMKSRVSTADKQQNRRHQNQYTVLKGKMYNLI